MNGINLDIPIELIVDALVHRLDTNKRFFSKLGDVVADKLIARANADDLGTVTWLNRLRNRFDSSVDKKFDDAVRRWLSDGYTSYTKATIERHAAERVNWAVSDAKLRAVKEIRAGVISLLSERKADLTNDQLITLLNALTDKE